MILNNKLHFIHIPKTGGISIDATLKDWDGRSPRNWTNRFCRMVGIPLPWRYALFRRHDSISLARKLGFGIQATPFSVVRDPYTHAISHFLQIHHHPANYPNEVRGFTVNAFLEWRLNRPPYISQDFKRGHWFAQMADQFSFLEIDGKLAVEHIIRFENLAEDLGKFYVKMGLLPPDMPHLNAGGGSLELDKVGVSLVNQIYKRDFDAFGYKMR